MGIKREDLILARLVDTLDFKQETYDKLLEDVKKREEIDIIFSKYPDEPIRGIIELDSEEIKTLLSFFGYDDISIEDINIKKYWLEEASYNENLRESIRYQESLRLFEMIGNYLEEYYEKLSYNNKSREDIKDLKLLNKSLNKSLKTNKAVGDLVSYLPLFESNKLFTDDNIIEIFSSIAKNNLRIIKNKKTGYIDTSDAIEKQTTLLLSDILKREIEDFNTKEPQIITSNKIELINEILASLKEDSSNIINYYPVELAELLLEVWDENKVEEELEKLSIPFTVLKGKEQGLNIEFNVEDKKILDEFIKDITSILLDIKDKEVKEKNNNENHIDVNKYKLIINKLSKKDKMYFEPSEFDLVIDLLNNKKIYKETIKNIIITMNSMNINLYNYNYENSNREVEKVDIEQLYPKKEDIKEEPKKEDLKVVKKDSKKKEDNLVSKYGYTFNSFPKKLINILNKELQEKEDLLEYIEDNKELSFIKEYNDIDTKKKINKKIYDVKAGQVYYLLMYSNKDIIKSLLDCSKKYKVDIKSIFSIPKVFGSTEIDGTYEYFINNIKYINKNYPDLLTDIMNKTPYTLGIDSQLLIRNIELSKLYNLSIETCKIDTKPSFRALGVKEYGYVLDRYIEADDYDYIERFRYQLDTNYNVALRVKYLQYKGIDSTQNGFVDINDNFSKDIVKEGKSDSIGYIELSKGSNDIKWLDSINEEKDKKLKEVRYIINGICISKPKVLITFGNLIKDNSDNISEKLLYSIVKDSYLTEDEFNKLKETIYNREDK